MGPQKLFPGALGLLIWILGPDMLHDNMLPKLD